MARVPAQSETRRRLSFPRHARDFSTTSPARRSSPTGSKSYGSRESPEAAAEITTAHSTTSPAARWPCSSSRRSFFLRGLPCASAVEFAFVLCLAAASDDRRNVHRHEHRPLRAPARSARRSSTRTQTSARTDIAFAIPAPGVQTIVLASPLPAITEPVIIDGFTQPGSSANTQPVGQGLNAVLQIQIDGTGAAAGPCFTVSAGNDDLLVMAIQGLVINRCPVGAIDVVAGEAARSSRATTSGPIRRARAFPGPRASESASSTRSTWRSAGPSPSSAI